MPIRRVSDPTIPGDQLGAVLDRLETIASRASIGPPRAQSLILGSEGEIPDLRDLDLELESVYLRVQLPPEAWGSERLIQTLERFQDELAGPCAMRCYRHTGDGDSDYSQTTLGCEAAPFVKWDARWQTDSPIEEVLARGLAETGAPARLSPAGSLEGIDGARPQYEQIVPEKKVATFKFALDCSWQEAFAQLGAVELSKTAFHLQANTGLAVRDQWTPLKLWDLVRDSEIDFSTGEHQVQVLFESVDDLEILQQSAIDLQGDVELGWIELAPRRRVGVGLQIDSLEGAALVLGGNPADMKRVESEFPDLNFSPYTERNES